MSEVVLDGLTAGYARTGPPVLDRLDLAVEPGSVTTLLGPSGCGKTTALRCIAGLLSPRGGDVRIAGRSVLDMPPERRDVAMVFQQPLLFPHLDVAGNVGFGLRMRGLGRADVRRRVADWLDLVHLTGLEGRNPSQLSGGQAQRAALARALAVQPRVLLLDEPLSQLDVGLRGEMRDLVHRLHRELGLTTILVTHDQDEAARLSDRVALLLDGRVEQVGQPQDLYDRPATLRVARFLGTANLLRGTVSQGFWAGPWGRIRTGAPDGPGTLVVRQEALAVSLDPDGDGVPGVVQVAQYRGTGWSLEVRLGDVAVCAVTPPTLKAAPGDLVRVHLPAGHAHVIPG